jgi:hypothetical protein
LRLVVVEYPGRIVQDQPDVVEVVVHNGLVDSEAGSSTVIVSPAALAFPDKVIFWLETNLVSAIGFRLNSPVAAVAVEAMPKMPERVRAAPTVKAISGLILFLIGVSLSWGVA